jgi:hypothetical protein
MTMSASSRSTSNILKPAVLGLLMVAACNGANTAHARSRIAPWCAWDPGIDNFNCGFYTHQQCMAAAWGNGGLCVPNSCAAYGDLRLRRRWR